MAIPTFVTTRASIIYTITHHCCYAVFLSLFLLVYNSRFIFKYDIMITSSIPNCSATAFPVISESLVIRVVCMPCSLKYLIVSLHVHLNVHESYKSNDILIFCYIYDCLPSDAHSLFKRIYLFATCQMKLVFHPIIFAVVISCQPLPI